MLNGNNDNKYCFPEIYNCFFLKVVMPMVTAMTVSTIHRHNAFKSETVSVLRYGDI